MPAIRRAVRALALLLAAACTEPFMPALGAQTVAPNHGVRPRRLVIRNAMVIEGNGSELLDGALNQSTTTQYAVITVASNGVGWDLL